MKYSYKPSPNYRSPQTTGKIMIDLIVCLLAVLTCSAVYYGYIYGIEYGIRVVLMAVVAVVCALVTETIYYKTTAKGQKLPRETFPTSGIVTALIITLITRLDVTYYAVGVSTVIAILFGKLVFGGFGQNIFNPAAVGEAIIMNYFASSKAAAVTADVFSGATPMAAMNSVGWVLSDTAMSGFLEQFGGLGGLLLGGYPSVIGASFSVIILICGAFLIWRKDIDWRMPATYLGVLFVCSLIVGLVKGSGFSFALFNVLGGGVLFGAVFMLTDPVTTPVSIPGRVVFGVGAAMITLVLRWKANLPEGVLFSILLMNMLTPAIDKFMSGNQIKDAAKLRNNTLITACLCMLVTLGVGLTLEPKADVNEIPDVADVIPVSSRTGIGDEELDAEAACQITENVGSKVVLSCSSKGFEGVNEATITIEDGAITSYEVTAFKDTVGVGDAAITDDALSRYKGLTLQKSVDVTSGATFTSTSVKAMAQKALKIAAGEAEESAPVSDGGADASAAKTLADEKFTKNEAACEMTDNVGSKASFNCSAKGYEGVNEATVVIEDGKVTEVTVTAFNDTEGVGDAAVSEAALEKYKGVDLSSTVDVTSGASNTSKSIKAMVQKALTVYEGE